MAEAKEGSWLSRLRRSLGKTRENLFEKVTRALSSRRKIDESLFEELEEALIQADVGVETTLRLIDGVRERVEREGVREVEQVRTLLEEAMVAIFREGTPLADRPAGEGPLTVVAVGVNGSGKTTTIGKLAARFREAGKRVVIGAGDTFRAAAIEQIAEWAKRSGAELVAHQAGSDPAAVAYDAVHAAKARRADVLLLDTAGRLQTKANLMNELNKVYRVVARELGREPDEILLVIDGTTGQNGLSQGRLFKEAVPVTGVVLTKLDGTAKGGIVLAVSRELSLPVKLIGVGEAVDDLRDFDARSFVSALIGEERTLDNSEPL